MTAYDKSYYEKHSSAQGLVRVVIVHDTKHGFVCVCVCLLLCCVYVDERKTSGRVGPTPHYGSQGCDSGHQT